METQKQTMPEGYTGVYRQTTLVTDEQQGNFVFGMNFSAYMMSKGAAPIYSGTSLLGEKNDVLVNEAIYFHPEFSVQREYDKGLASHQALVITQPEGTENTILEDILNDFPEFRKITEEKKGVRDPSTARPCF